MIKLKLIAGFLIMFTACSQPVDLREDTSYCIKRKIIEFEANDFACDKGATVYRYKFQGRFVYAFNPGPCGADMISPVYDEACNEICGLGGIIGNTMCNGDDFSKATGETLIWEDK